MVTLEVSSLQPEVDLGDNTRVDLVDIKVVFSTARVDLAAATIIDKALAVHKVFVEQKVDVVHKAAIGKFLAEYVEFQFGTNKFQPDQLPQTRDFNQATFGGLPIE